MHLERTCPARHLPRLGPTIPNDQPASPRVPLLAVGLDVLPDLHRQGRHQHPPGSLPGQLVHRLRTALFRRNFVVCSIVVEYLQHGWRLLSPACQPEFSRCSRERIRRLLQTADPQLLVISPRRRPRVCLLLDHTPCARPRGSAIDLAHATLADEGGHVVAPYALEPHSIRPETEDVIPPLGTPA